MKLDFRPIQLADKDIFKKYSSYTDTLLGWEYSFAMTWIWNAFEKTQVCDTGDMAFVWTQFFGDYVYFPPLLKDKNDFVKAVDIISKQCCKCGCAMDLRGLTKEQVDLLDKDKFTITTSLDTSDYIYSGNELSELVGKKFHSKRNFVSRFKRNYEYIFREYNDSQDKKQIFDLYKKWNANAKHETLDIEEKVISNALNNYKELGLDISVIEIDGKVMAFAINSISNKDVAHTLFEKADTDYEGSYQAINQFNAQKYLSEVKYVNRQEDLGIEGLRKAKQSYNPIMLLQKYNVKVKV